MALNINKALRIVLGRKRARHLEWRIDRALICTERNKVEGIFDPEWYLAVYPDVRELGVDPAHHFIHHGAAEDRRPGPAFDPRFYVEAYPDVLTTGLDPLLHYIRKGRAEGRAPNVDSYEGSGLFRRHEIVKPFAIAELCEAAVLLAHAPAGRLGPGVWPLVELLETNGIAVLLVVGAGQPVDFLPAELEAASGILVCEDSDDSFVADRPSGRGFAAWAQAITLFPEIWASRTL
jgi:hypothetical protein